MYLTLVEAAKLAGVSRTTLYKRNKEGKLSFSINEAGHQVVDAAELSRLYTLQVDRDTNRDTPKEQRSEADFLQIKLDAAQEKIALLERQIDNLQTMFQHEQGHVTKLLNTSEQLMLTHDQKQKTFLQRIKKLILISG